jgi:hypothetical protein
VSVYCIVANTVPYADSTTNLSFSLDSGASTGNYMHIPDSTNTILYNSLVWSKSGLDNVPHTLVITPLATSSTPSLTLFDYVEYTSVIWPNDTGSFADSSSSYEAPDPISSPASISPPSSTSPSPSATAVAPTSTSNVVPPSSTSTDASPLSTSTTASPPSTSNPISPPSPTSTAPTTGGTSTNAGTSSTANIVFSPPGVSGTGALFSRTPVSTPSGYSASLANPLPTVASFADHAGSSLASTAPSSSTSAGGATTVPVTRSVSSNVGAIAGGAAGAVCLLLLAALAIFCCRRRRRAAPMANSAVGRVPASHAPMFDPTFRESAAPVSPAFREFRDGAATISPFQDEPAAASPFQDESVVSSSAFREDLAAQAAHVPRAGSPKEIAELRRQVIAHGSPLVNASPASGRGSPSPSFSGTSSSVRPLPVPGANGGAAAAVTAAPVSASGGGGGAYSGRPVSHGAQVQLLQAEIERLRAAYAEGAPPTYFSHAPPLQPQPPQPPAVASSLLASGGDAHDAIGRDYDDDYEKEPLDDRH